MVFEIEGEVYQWLVQAIEGQPRMQELEVLESSLEMLAQSNHRDVEKIESLKALLSDYR